MSNEPADEVLDKILDSLKMAGIQAELEAELFGDNRTLFPLWNEMPLREFRFKLHGQDIDTLAVGFSKGKIKATTQENDTYEVKYIITGLRTNEGMKAHGKPKRKLFGYGRIIGYGWKGDRLAEALGRDQFLNEAFFKQARDAGWDYRIDVDPVEDLEDSVSVLERFAGFEPSILLVFLKHANAIAIRVRREAR